jgi:hypothetical protein
MPAYNLAESQNSSACGRFCCKSPFGVMNENFQGR